MIVSIIIPCYNEEKTIREIIQRIIKVKLDNITKEIIIVNDGSTDKTVSIVNSLYKQKHIILLSHKKNLGKGAAIKTGIKASSGEIILIQDADLEYSPSDYASLIRPIIRKKFKVVYGSRELKRTNREYSYLVFYWGGLLVTKVANFLYGTKLTDVPTGYKVFDSTIIKQIHLRSNGFEFCPEVTAKIARLNIPIKEVPVKYTPRSLEEGKKISWRDGLVAIWTLVKYRFVD